jgi:anti-sigma factor RsiW
MLCRKIEELLQTDYLDARLEEAQVKQLQEHLARCSSCAKLEKDLQAQRILFKQAKPKQPPEQVWENIRDRIITERLNAESRKYGLIERLKGWLWQPRPAFALATAFALIIMVAVFAGNLMFKKISFPIADDAGLATVYNLNGESGDSLSDLGTSIEEYFL